jgi:serine/threonine-protein kinase OSR1/STK39
MKVKTRVPVPSIATSGRWSKRADGEWVFDLDEYPKAGAENEEAAAAALTAAAASGKLRDASEDEDEQTTNIYENTVNENNINVYINQNDNNFSKSSNLDNPTITSKSNLLEENNTSTSPPPIHLVLRMRDEKKELQDIKFDFLPNKDTVDEISHELVNAKLIDAIDMVAVSANLNKILENRTLSPITFPLVSFFMCLSIHSIYSFSSKTTIILIRNPVLVQTKCPMKKH